MDTATAVRLPYQWRLFILLVSFSLVLTACFVGFQYSRERRYKADSLDAALQVYNAHILDELSGGMSPEEAVGDFIPPLKDTRVSVIDADGRLVYDNTLDSMPKGNHLGRPEIRQALAAGKGYTISRHSESIDRTFFYSATKGDSLVVRSAVPYGVSLREVLRADRSFLWFMAAVTLVIALLAYLATRRIGLTITRLNDFAARAERGERIYDNIPFPHDEFGSISNHIVRLYARLQQTAAQRDAEHRRALHEQQERIRIKKQLTNNINHELKTPVAAIKASLETVLAHPGMSRERLEGFVSQADASTDRLISLLNDVAVITRLDDGTSGIEMKPTDIRPIVADVIEEEAPRLRQAGMEVITDIPREVTVEGNTTFIESIFRNIIDNSIAYSRGTRITIRLLSTEGGMALFSIDDDGTGIPEEHLERIFERFYRIDKGRSRRLGGTGLGLSIVKNAVMLHGGTITARNLQPHGVSFRFSLSLARN